MAKEQKSAGSRNGPPAFRQALEAVLAFGPTIAEPANNIVGVAYQAEHADTRITNLEETLGPLADAAERQWNETVGVASIDDAEEIIRLLSALARIAGLPFKAEVRRPRFEDLWTTQDRLHAGEPGEGGAIRTTLFEELPLARYHPEVGLMGVTRFAILPGVKLLPDGRLRGSDR